MSSRSEGQTVLRARHAFVVFICLTLYAIAGWTLRSHPLARSILGNAVLASSAGLVILAIWSRRRSWAACQRLFWDMFAIGMAFWILGHFGWAFDDLVLQNPSWLQWHTVFSLCGGIAPLIALLARPHRGTRPFAVATLGFDLAACGLLAIFVYSYFVLVPSLVPAAEDRARSTLLLFVQINRLLLLVGLIGAAWFARKTDWYSTYLRLAVGVAIGFVLRIGTSLAISRGEYHPGSVHDFAWIVPWLCYAWAALEAPPSSVTAEAIDIPEPPSSVMFSAVPVLLIPVIGYGMVAVDPLGPPLDSFRRLLTSVTTVGGLALLTIRLAAQRGAWQRSDARLKLLAAATERTADLILITRADGSFEHANEAFLRTLGYTRAEVGELERSELLAVGSSELGTQIVDSVQRTGGWRGTLLRRRKDGSTFSSACAIAALRNSAGNITHYVGVERDISEELRLRDQLVHSERLSAIGELVAGVAHEINNPLQTIVGCVELMLDDRPGAVSKHDLETVRREAARAGQIVRNLLSFVRRGASDRAVIDLTQIVRTTVDLREYHLRQCNIAIDASYDPDPLSTMVNRDEIQQVVLNLLLNAEHAIAASGQPGTISVTTSAEGSRHIVEVADSGPGITQELRGRVFEPFFTTKDVGEGTGLGLSISHGIASAHGGSLELRDSEIGAKFRLTLPAYHEGPATATKVTLRRREDELRSVLVVDDEAPIRRLLARLLERRGFSVHEAETGDVALSLAGSHRFGLVICDVRMPGISGIELHRRFREKGNSVTQHFVFMTGDTNVVEPGMEGHPHSAVLAKPFTAADLDALLARLVNT
jgi:PAS domain S-box-containing protein